MASSLADLAFFILPQAPAFCPTGGFVAGPEMNNQRKNTGCAKDDPKGFAAVKKIDEYKEYNVFYNSYPMRLSIGREGNFGFAEEDSFEGAFHCIVGK